MSTRKLSIILPAALAFVAVAAFVGVGFVNARQNAPDDQKPGLTQYLASLVGQERAAETDDIEVVAEIDPVASPDTGDDEAVLGDSAVTRDEVPPPSSWFRRDRSQSQVRVEFTCVAGPGGSKVCTAETIRR